MTSQPPGKIAVVGAGCAGVNTAAFLRQNGFDGELVLFGAETELPYHRPVLSKDYLKGALPEHELHLKAADFYRDQHIDLRLGSRVTAIDPETKRVHLASGPPEACDGLVLATGARPRRLSLPGAELPGVLELRTLADSHTLAAHFGPAHRVVLVGAGYVGLEVAASARHLGCLVTVLEREDRVLARVAGATLASFLADIHSSRGCVIRTGVAVTEFRAGAEGALEVVLGDGEALPADTIVVGVGAYPDTELAEAAGLTCAGGIPVDEHARTDWPQVYAVGDVTIRQVTGGAAMRLESIPSATEQAKQAAAHILGMPAPKPEVPWFWSDQYAAKVKIAGIVPAGDDGVVRTHEPGERLSVFHLREGRVTAVETVNCAPDFMAGKQLIDKQIPVAAQALADPAVALRDILKGATTHA